MYLKYLSCLMMACLINCAALAQIAIRGTLQSDTGEALPFANILLLHANDSTRASAAVTALNGSFVLHNIHNGMYLLIARMVGYQPYQNTLSVDTTTDILHPVIQLTEESWMLDEVVVKAEHLHQETRGDRTVVHLENSLASSGKTVLEVLENSPGVSVNRFGGNIQLGGKSGVQIMLNGKMTRLPPDAVIQMLDGLNASGIEKIELITSPPSQYDAEGEGGIIHIIMKDQEAEGANGEVGFNAGFNQAETAGANISLGHKMERLQLFGNYSYQYDHNKHKWINYREVNQTDNKQTTNTVSDRDPKTTVHNMMMQADFAWTKKTDLNLSFTGYQRDWDMFATSSIEDEVKPAPPAYTVMDTKELNRWQSASSGLQLTHHFEDDRYLKVALDHLFYQNHNPSEYVNTFFNEDNTSTNELIEVSKDTPIQFLIGSFDYEWPFSDVLTLSVGTKWTQSRFTNDVTVREWDTDHWIVNQRFSNSVGLQESIGAVYLASTWKESANTIITGGLRYEATKSNLVSNTAGESFRRRFSNFFPSILISKSISESTQLEASYSRRITRPSFNDMAPFVLFLTPNTFFAGNPSLLPSLTSSIVVNLQQSRYTMSLRYAHTHHEIARLQPLPMNEHNEQIFRSQNLDYMHTWALTTTVPVDMATAWWELQPNFSIYHQRYTGNLQSERVSGHANRLSANVIATFQLPKDFKVEVSGNYDSGSLWGVARFKPMGEVGMGIRKIFPRATITLNATDIFNTSVWRMESDSHVDEATLGWDYYWNKRAISLTYSHILGSGDRILSKKKLRAGEERSRVMN